MATVTIGTIGGTMTNAQLQTALNNALGADLTRQGTTNSKIYRCVDNLVIQGNANVEGFTFICAHLKSVQFVGSAGSPATITSSTYISGTPYLPLRIIHEGRTPFNENTVPIENGYFLYCGANLNAMEITVMGDGTNAFSGVNISTAQAVNIGQLSVINENPSGYLYTTINVASTSVIRMAQLRASSLRLNSNFDFGFIGVNGWAYGESGNQTIKLLSLNNSVMKGFAPNFVDTSGVIQLTSPNFTASGRTFRDSFLTPSRITLYPGNNDNTLANIERTIYFYPQTPTGTAINGVSTYITSSRTITGNPAGDVAGNYVISPATVRNNGDSLVVRVWKGYRTNNAGNYDFAVNRTDDSNLTILYRKNNKFENSISITGYQDIGNAIGSMSDDTYWTQDASGYTGIVVDKVAKIITVTQSHTLDEVYDYMKYWMTQNMDVANMLTPNGKIIDIANYSIIGLEFLTSGTKLDTIQSSATHTANAAFGNLKVNGNVTQATPTNLSGVTITGTLTYNTNTDTSITITNTNIGTVANSGTGIVTITPTNSIITIYTDAEINFLDSSLNVIGAISVTAYPTATDRNNNTNAIRTWTDTTEFKYAGVWADPIFLKLDIGFVAYKDVTLTLGENEVDLGTTGLLANIEATMAKEATLLQTKTEVIEAIDDVSVGSGGLTIEDIEASEVLAKESSVQSVKTKVDTIDTIIDTVKTKVDTLENTDLTLVAKEATLLQTESDLKAEIDINEVKIDLIKTKVDTLENFDDTDIIAEINANETKIDAIKVVVDTLENYDDTTTQTKLDTIDTVVDAIKVKVDTLENTDTSTLAEKTDLAPIKRNTDLIPATV